MDRVTTSLLLLQVSLLAFVCAPAHADLFVVDSGSNDVQQYDAETGALIAIFGETGTTTNSLSAIAFHPHTKNLFVTNGFSGVQEFDRNTGALIGTFGDTGDELSQPVAMAFDPVTANLFVVDNSNSTPMIMNGDVRVFDGRTGEFKGSFGQTQAILSGPLGLVFHPITGNLLVSGLNPIEAEFGVWEFDQSSGDFLGAFGDTATLGVAGKLAIRFQDSALYVSNVTATPIRDDVRRFSATGSFEGDLKLPSLGATSLLISPMGLTFDPLTGDLLVADTVFDSVQRFDPLTGVSKGVFGATAGAVNPTDLAFSSGSVHVDLALDRRGPTGAFVGSQITVESLITNLGATDATQITLNEAKSSVATFVSAQRVRRDLDGSETTSPLVCMDAASLSGLGDRAGSETIRRVKRLGNVSVGQVCAIDDLAPRETAIIQTLFELDPDPFDFAASAATVTALQLDPFLSNNSVDIETLAVADSVTVPDVEGMTLTQVEQLIDIEATLELFARRALSDTISRTVVSQSPAPGTSVAIGSELEVLVSVGLGPFLASWAQLPTNGDESARDNDWIDDHELADWIFQSLPNQDPSQRSIDADIVILATNPFSGDWLDNFDDATDSNQGGAAWDSIRFTNTTIITPNVAGNYNVRGAAGDGMLAAAIPGATTAQVLDAGIDDAFFDFIDVELEEIPFLFLEAPQLRGDDTRQLGGVTGTHLWCGRDRPTRRSMRRSIAYSTTGSAIQTPPSPS